MYIAKCISGNIVNVCLLFIYTGVHVSYRSSTAVKNSVHMASLIFIPQGI